ncbi:MAG: hypothetical protein HY564_01740 [Candidatus Jacksonbacteria bacterium]|nr:hypothetical protein [Candidatus Jacksonbacteria bacterium]
MDDQQNYGQQGGSDQSGQGGYGQQGFGQRQMFQGNWTCAQCGSAITELPFEPDGTRPVYCRNCHRDRRGSGPSRGPRRRF